MLVIFSGIRLVHVSKNVGGVRFLRVVIIMFGKVKCGSACCTIDSEVFISVNSQPN